MRNLQVQVLCLLLPMAALAASNPRTRWTDVPELLRPGDCLVMNDSRVLPARLLGTRETGGAVEVLLLREPPDVPVMLVPMAMAPAPTAPPRSEQHSASATTRPAVCFFFGCVCSGCCGIW